jgi:hypothetical protein
MSLGHFVTVFLPYCLERQPDGKYVVLNREYKPVGFKTTEHITYADYPICVEIKGLTPTLAAKLSCYGRQDTDKIQLYEDASDPQLDSAHMNAYLERLKLLANIEVT